MTPPSNGFHWSPVRCKGRSFP